MKHISSSTVLLTDRERKNNLALNLIDRELKQVKTVNTSGFPWSIKPKGDEIWCCQQDFIDVYDDTKHHSRHLKLYWTRDAALLSQGHIVIAGENGLRNISKTGKYE